MQCTPSVEKLKNTLIIYYTYLLGARIMTNLDDPAAPDPPTLMHFGTTLPQCDVCVQAHIFDPMRSTTLLNHTLLLCGITRSALWRERYMHHKSASYLQNGLSYILANLAFSGLYRCLSLAHSLRVGSNLCFVGWCASCQVARSALDNCLRSWSIRLWSIVLWSMW